MHFNLVEVASNLRIFLSTGSVISCLSLSSLSEIGTGEKLSNLLLSIGDFFNPSLVKVDDKSKSDWLVVVWKCIAG